MADKTYNIKTSEGETISIPAWATEETLKKVVKSLGKSDDINKKVSSMIAGIDDNIEDVVKMLTTTMKDQAKENRKDKSSDDKKGKYWKEIGSNVKDTFESNDAVDFLKNGATLLNKSVFKPTNKAMGKSLTSKFPKIMGSVAKFAGPLGMAAQLASDALFAWAGMVAAAYTDAAKMSSSMINFGALIDSNVMSFGELQGKVLGTGMNFEDFGKLVENFAPTLAGLGGDVGTGVQQITGVLDNLNVASREYGSFGLGIEERNAEFMTFLENKRMSGMLDNGIQGQSNNLINEFVTMQNEISSLSTLTGQARSDIFAQRMAALSAPDTSAIRELLSRQGEDGSRAVFESMVAQASEIELALGDAASPVTTLMAATKDAILAANGELSNINLRAFIQQRSPELLTLLSDDIHRYEEVLKSGNAEAADLFLIDMFRNMDLLDVAVGADPGAMAETVKEVSLFQTRLDQFLGQVENETEEERAVRLAENKERLESMGSFQDASNTIQELKREMISALLPNLQSLASGAEDLLNGLKDFISWLNPFDNTDGDVDMDEYEADELTPLEFQALNENAAFDATPQKDTATTGEDKPADATEDKSNNSNKVAVDEENIDASELSPEILKKLSPQMQRRIEAANLKGDPDAYQLPASFNLPNADNSSSPNGENDITVSPPASVSRGRNKPRRRRGDRAGVTVSTDSVGDLLDSSGTLGNSRDPVLEPIPIAPMSNNDTIQNFTIPEDPAWDAINTGLQDAFARLESERASLQLERLKYVETQKDFVSATTSMLKSQKRDVRKNYHD